MFVRKYDPRTRPVGRGLVQRVADWRPSMTWADLVVLEGNGFSMAEFGRWRDRGAKILGGDEKSAAWELDRNIGMKRLKEHGIAVPPYREFSDYDDAIRFVEHRAEVFFSKPCSDTADKSLSAKTGVPEDPAWMLHQWKKKHGKPPCPFLLQEKVDGIEVGVGGWFGPAGFADAWEENFEHKRFMAGDVGPNTGEMGTVLRFVRRSKLADRVLKPFEDALERLHYAGNIDVNCIVDPEGNAWPLEFTMRLGWPAFNIELDLFDAEPLEFLYGVAAGEPLRRAHKLDEVAVGVVAVIPPYPHAPKDYDEIIAVPIFGVDDDLHGWHSCEVAGRAALAGAKAAKAGASGIESAGHYVGVACGTGATVRQAARGAYKVLDRLSMPASPFWRIDIGDRLKRDLPELQKHGFVAGMEF